MTAVTDFDPDAFLVVPARTFEDLRIGEVFRGPSRTLTDAHAAAFQTSLWTITRCTTTPSGRASTDMSRRLCTASVHDQRGQLVLSGQHRYLLRRQRAVRNGDG
jgi:hypothetical protein